MPMSTYVRPGSIPQPTDPDICVELEACRVAGLRVPIVEELIWTTHRSWWQRKQPPTILYSVLWPMSDFECQILGFFGPGLCTEVPKQTVLAYLYGYLTRGGNAP